MCLLSINMTLVIRQLLRPGCTVYIAIKIFMPLKGSMVLKRPAIYHLYQINSVDDFFWCCAK